MFFCTNLYPGLWPNYRDVISTVFEINGETKVNSFELCSLGSIWKEEVLRFKISMNHSMFMTYLHTQVNIKAGTKQTIQRDLRLVDKKKKKRFETFLISHLDNFKNGFSDGCSCTFSVMPSGNNTVKKLSSFTNLHDKIDRVFVLESFLEGHDIRMFRQTTHDLNLSSYILNIYLRP